MTVRGIAGGYQAGASRVDRTGEAWHPLRHADDPERRVVVAHARAGCRALSESADPHRPGSPDWGAFFVP